MAINVWQKHGSFKIMLDVNVNISGNVVSQQLFFMIIITTSSKNVTGMLAKEKGKSSIYTGLIFTN